MPLVHEAKQMSSHQLQSLSHTATSPF